MPRALKLALIWLAYFVGSIPIMFMMSCSTLYLIGSNHTQTIDPHAVPPEFPVVVITRGEPARPNGGKQFDVMVEQKLKSGDVASVVEYQNLPRFTAQYDSYSYLIPANETGELESALPNEHEFTGIEIKAAGPGQQQIVLDASLYDDVTDKSWYEATDHAITPQKYQSHGDFFVGMAAGFASPLPTLALSLFSASFMTWKKSRPPKMQAMPARAGGPSA